MSFAFGLLKLYISPWTYLYLIQYKNAENLIDK